MGNAGDEALLVSLLQALPQSITPIVLSKKPAETQHQYEDYGIQVVDRWDLWAIVSAMSRSLFCK